MNKLTEHQDTSVFKLEYMGMRTYEKMEYNVMNDIIIEMNSSLIMIERNGYTFMDVLSDIGGI